MIPFHIKLAIKQRNLPFSENYLEEIAQSCRDSTAVLLAKLNENITVKNSPDQHRTESRSNGDLIILIVRERKPITIMLRRSNQPLTPQALKVTKILKLM